jgi:hypothetical protein
MSDQTIKKKDITAELIRELDTELSRFTVKLDERLNNLLPIHIFKEKHTKGYLWWKKTYYAYYRYSEGSMLSIGKIDVKHFENKFIKIKELGDK